MNKKGYTLIELITVIALLSITVIIVAPRINNTFKTSRADQLEEVRENIVKVTEVYLNSECGKDNYNKLINNDSIKIYLSTIKDCGLIENKIYNPVSGNYFNINDEYVEASINEVGMIDYKLSF